MKKSIACIVPVLMIALTACHYDPAALEQKNNEEKEAKKEYIMEQMEECLNEKYADVAAKMRDEDSDEAGELFDVYDLSKGSNKAWFQYGYYPATAISYLDEDDPVVFDVKIKTDGKKFGPFEDNYYGELYGEQEREDLEDLIARYPVEDTNIVFETSEDIIRDEQDLREHLTVWGKYHVTDSSELDDLCELVDELDSFGCRKKISIYNDIKGNSSRGIEKMTSDDIRAYFEGE